MATAYFHGDSSCYGSMCRLSLPFLMRYPLVIGQGSLGTQEENGLQAAPRYSEAKPSPYAELMFNDFSKNVVPLVLTYNEEYEEDERTQRQAAGITEKICEKPGEAQR